jgi:hypothetical protein
MADASDHTTPWRPFSDVCIERAEKIPHDAGSIRLRDAAQLTITDIYNHKLDVRWRNANGEVRFGPPPAYFPVYDPVEDVIADKAGHGRAYRVEVRERWREAAMPADCPPATAPELAPEPGTSDVDGRVSHQWVWQKDSKVLAKDNTELRRIQRECQRRLEPSVQLGSTAKICKALEGAGVKDISPSSVRRAFGRESSLKRKKPVEGSPGLPSSSSEAYQTHQSRPSKHTKLTKTSPDSPS